MTARLFARVWRVVLFLSFSTGLASSIVGLLRGDGPLAAVSFAFAVLAGGSMLLHAIDQIDLEDRP